MMDLPDESRPPFDINSNAQALAIGRDFYQQLWIFQFWSGFDSGHFGHIQFPNVKFNFIFHLFLYERRTEHVTQRLFEQQLNMTIGKYNSFAKLLSLDNYVLFYY